MASVYSTRFASGTHSGSGVTPIYTVPAGQTAVLRDVALFCSSAGANSAYIQDPGGTPVAFFASTAQFGFYHWTGRVVFAAGEVIDLGIFTGTWNYSLSGYLLTP